MLDFSAMFPSARVAAAALLLLLVASSAGASVVVPMEVEALARKADLVVRGKAAASRSAWSGDGRRIQTTTRIEVARLLKGQAPQVLEVVTPGGEVGDIGQKVSGAAEFSPGEEVFLFLERSPDGARFVVSGMAQGKFSVRARPGGAVVTQSVDGLEVLGSDRQVRPAPRFEPVAEAEFVARVERALRQERP
jgi:hypothetical protein